MMRTDLNIDLDLDLDPDLDPAPPLVSSNLK